MTRRDNAAFRDPANYPRSLTVRALFNDMDAFRHVNNIAIARWLEEGRADLNRSVFGLDALVNPPDNELILLASTHIEYLAQVNYPGSADVATAVNRIGTSSFAVAQALFAAGVCATIAETVMVFARDDRAAPLSAEHRTELAKYVFTSAD